MRWASKTHEATARGDSVAPSRRLAPAAEPRRLLASATRNYEADATSPAMPASPAVHASLGGPADSAFALGEERAADAARGSERELVAGIVATYVVEKYIVEKIVESEPTLLAVTTSVPSAPETSLSDGAMR